jgi:hypothetical protein
MPSRADRLEKLLHLQQRIKEVHQTRRAGFLAASAKALEEAEDLRQRADAADSLSSVFPALYSKHIAEALDRSAKEREKAEAEARQVATATIRANRVEQQYREAQALEERQAEDRERLEMIEQLLPSVRSVDAD